MGCMAKILFVCVQNAGRSKMAEAFAKKYGIDAASAGTEPAGGINPLVVQAMKEKGIDLSDSKPRLLAIEMIEEADRVVTMGCSVEKVCPAPIARKMGKKLTDWALEDPKGKDIDGVRKIRDEIEKRVLQLSKE
jgi:protein-tyrosine-phosphatase